MFTTEADAKAMACPIARVRGVPPDADGNVQSKCAGRECILWRWRNDTNDPIWRGAIKEVEDRLRADGVHHMTAHKQAVAEVNERLSEVYAAAGDNRQGYCGLGGKP